MHAEYTLHGGEVLTLPPIEKRPPCTCGRRKAGRDVEIVCITFRHPDDMTREEAERNYEAYNRAYGA
jgi:hypothetical protein